MNNDEKIANKCVFCGSDATIIHFDRNMWYVQCSNSGCKKHDKYAYLGSTKNLAIDAWNFINRQLNRTSTKKKKKDDESGNLQ